MQRPSVKLSTPSVLGIKRRTKEKSGFCKGTRDQKERQGMKIGSGGRTEYAWDGEQGRVRVARAHKDLVRL